ncbi:MAG: DUF2779 domain-containing protein [Burkholderiales bacterium]|jgi:hypothetical protein|nr:DUF2779 domain-containing protein [Burkholderiales bacterium]
MRALSKSKLIAFRQCPKRLWLEVHRPELCVVSEDAKARFQAGHEVGAVARRLYDPAGTGVLIDPHAEGFDEAFARTRSLLESSQPIFEAGFSAKGALAFADIMLPVGEESARSWRMVEVKSTTSVKDYQRDDIAIQTFIALAAVVRLDSVAVAYIDNSWVYPGGGDYKGLFHEEDLTEEAMSRGEEVEQWIKEAQKIVCLQDEPTIKTGAHCSAPFDCGFSDYCRGQEPQAEYPAEWLPRLQTNAVKDFLNAHPNCDMREVPDELLNDKQKRVKAHTLSGETFFDRDRCAADLVHHKPPLHFLDFETAQLAVPIWLGTKPYQQIPFQFSLHRLGEDGTLTHREFLDLSGNDPSEAFAKALVDACGKSGTVFAYNAGFEKRVVKELAERFPRCANELLAINERVVDLLPIVREHYYHPSQQGSWGLKKVLPAIAPDLSYTDLDGVQDGGMAMTAFLEAIDSRTLPERKAEIQKQLLKYCALDTFALVRVLRFLEV